MQRRPSSSAAGQCAAAAMPALQPQRVQRAQREGAPSNFMLCVMYLSSSVSPRW